MTAEPAGPRWSAGPLTRQPAGKRLIRWVGNQSFVGYGIFAVVDKVTGEYLGETGIGQFYREVHPDFDGVDEASWTFIGRCHGGRSEEHTSELQSLMRISYAVFCLKKKKNTKLYN